MCVRKMAKDTLKIDFLCVGFSKCATSSMHDTLKNHPDVCLPKIKETFYLKWHKKYKNSINRLKNEYYVDYDYNKTIGSFEPTYYNKAKEVYELYGKDVKLIFMIRNPSYTTYSHAKMKFRSIYKKEILKYYKKYKTYDERINAYLDNYIKNDIVKRFEYDKWISEYLKYFDIKNMHFIIFENLIKNPDKEIELLEKFLNINTKVKLEFKHSNIGNKVPKNYICACICYLVCRMKFKMKGKSRKTQEKFDRFRRKVNSKIMTPYNGSLDCDMEKKLNIYYIENIHNLEKIINISFKGLWY
jgi:hypothetical protein